jgi:hypothetical protein
MSDFSTFAIAVVISCILAILAGLYIGWTEPFPHKNKQRVLLVFGIPFVTGFTGSLWAINTNVEAILWGSWAVSTVFSLFAECLAIAKAPALKKVLTQILTWNPESDGEF